MDPISYNDPVNLIEQDLAQLDETPVLLDGKLIKPSQCYKFSGNPLHVLYNTNCPDDLMGKIEAIMLKHKPANEDLG